MPIMLADLIARVPSEVEAKVRRVRDRIRPALQEALRSECRLVLRTPEDAANNRSTDLQSVANWSAALLKVLDQHDPLKSVLGVNQDFLGIYDYDSRALFVDEQAINRATIRLYWGVIGLVSQWLGCDVCSANSRTCACLHQLGADIEGRRWAAPLFAKAKSALTEGLAQYYTDRVLHRLERRYA